MVCISHVRDSDDILDSEMSVPLSDNDVLDSGPCGIEVQRYDPLERQLVALAASSVTAAMVSCNNPVHTLRRCLRCLPAERILEGLLLGRDGESWSWLDPEDPDDLLSD